MWPGVWQVVCRDYPRPALETSAPFKEAAALSSELKRFQRPERPLRVLIAGGGARLTASCLRTGLDPLAIYTPSAVFGCRSNMPYVRFIVMCLGRWWACAWPWCVGAERRVVPGMQAWRA